MPRSKKSTIQTNPLSAISLSSNKGEPRSKSKPTLATKTVAPKTKKLSPAKKVVPAVATKKKKPVVAPKASKKTVSVTVTKKIPAKVASSTPPIAPAPPTQLTQTVHHETAKTEKLRQELTKKEMANIVIKKWSQLASLVVIAPLPFLATTTSTGIQITMIRDLCKIYNVPFHRQLVKASIGSILSSGTGIFSVSFIARELLQSIPYLGTAFVVVTQPTIVYKITQSLGGIFVRHFEKNGDLTNLDLDASRQLIKSSVKQ